jgi:hypothetical protein
MQNLAYNSTPMEKDKLSHQDVIDYVRADEVNLELGLISLTSVTKSEQLLMLFAVRESRLLDMVSMIGASYVEQEASLSNEERLKYNMLARIEALETNQPLESNADNSHLISLWELDEYLNTLNLPVGEVSKFIGFVVRGGTPNPSVLNLAVSNRQYIEGLIIFRDNEMPQDLPIDKRRFINMPVLQTAFYGGEFKRLFGVSKKRLAMAEKLIEHWRTSTSQSVEAEQPVDQTT